MAESAAPNSTTSSTLSAWAGPYVTNMLGKAQAVSNQPYALYGGDMTAGPSALQSKAFQGIGGLTLPSNTTSYNPMQFSSGLPGTSASQPFGVGSTESYMNPYLEQVLQPQLREARRQAEIDRINNASRMTKAGSYGGSRQAILEAELQRNLGTKVSDLTGKGYSDAFTNAQNQQFRTAQLGMDAQKATDASRQFGAGLGLDIGRFGLSSLDQMLRAGETERGIEQQGLTADYNEFARQRDYPMEQLKFQQSMLQGMPLSTVQSTPNPVSGLQNAVGTAAGVASLYEALKKLGLG